MNDFYLLGRESKKEVASAFAPVPVKSDHKLISDLEKTSKLPFDLKLVKLTINNEGTVRTGDLTGWSQPWLDYQPNSLGWPLMSIKLKEFVSESLTGDEGIDWILVKVNGPEGSRNYYIPRFEKLLDVLDVENTLYEKDNELNFTPHLSLNKVNQLSLFHCPRPGTPWKITSNLYVNFLLKKAIQKNRLTGMTFERVSAT
jgi:hypothetical protein